ncbi:hypothetical protein JOB18_043517 [Solea senegalensis]|uniref:Uncharacterized protein n=1 Tax=Solea senegalensis TaxID=28829 RepID=A0AAV6R2R3_SOLSE|nr:hypothetical protein JOB18_043517 [Solea senegalensis]
MREGAGFCTDNYANETRVNVQTYSCRGSSEALSLSQHFLDALNVDYFVQITYEKLSLVLCFGAVFFNLSPTTEEEEEEEEEEEGHDDAPAEHCIEGPS